MANFLMRVIIIFLGIIILIPLIGYEIRVTLAFYNKTKFDILVEILKTCPDVMLKITEIAKEKSAEKTQD